MSIITLTGYKGGISKTTSAVCLATLLNRSKPTLLIDSDPNRSASLWARKGKLPFTVCNDLEARKLLLRGEFEHVVIDTPARPAEDEIESLARGCDLLILPCTPDPLAMGALAQIARSLPEGTNYRCLLTIVPPAPQRDGKEAREALTRNGFPCFKTMIRRYKAYIKAADAGLTLPEVSGGGIAWHDWEALGEELSNVI